MQIVPRSQCSSIVHSTVGDASSHSPALQLLPSAHPALVRQPLTHAPASQMRPGPPHSLSFTQALGARGAVGSLPGSRPSPSSPRSPPDGFGDDDDDDGDGESGSSPSPSGD